MSTQLIVLFSLVLPSISLNQATFGAHLLCFLWTMRYCGCSGWTVSSQKTASFVLFSVLFHSFNSRKTVPSNGKLYKNIHMLESKSKVLSQDSDLDYVSCKILSRPMIQSIQSLNLYISNSLFSGKKIVFRFLWEKYLRTLRLISKMRVGQMVQKYWNRSFVISH